MKFAQPRSAAEPSFWMALGSHKLNVVKLSEDPIQVVSRIGVEGRPGGRRDDVAAAAEAASVEAAEVVPPRVRLDGESLSSDGASTFSRNECMRVPSSIRCLNTVEAFKKADKNAFLDDAAKSSVLRVCGVASMTEEGAGDMEKEEDLSLLLTTVCLSHLDLKKHIYLYWFAFPSLMPRKGRAVRYTSSAEMGQSTLIDAWGVDAVRDLRREYQRLRVQRLKNINVSDINSIGFLEGCPPFFLITRDSSGSMKCVELFKATYEQLTEEEREFALFAFLDTTRGGTGKTETGSTENYLPLGWSLRNMIAYLTLKLKLGGRSIGVVSYRPTVLRRIDTSKEGFAVDVDTDESSDIIKEEDSSLLLRIDLPSEEDYDWSLDSESPASVPLYRHTGFEPNARGRPGPRTVNLSPLLSPAHLAAQASDLNLRLMKWRAVPNLNLEKLSTSKVLLLGAGTLGCGVARTLQGWGIRNITLVDNGRVSYSNPVRQSLFELSDCAEGGKFKAEAAAQSLKRIAGEENMNSQGVALTIPMPGHPFGTEKAEEVARNDTQILSDLIKDCDVVFLLTDTRESRWLPTVMARSEGKMLINAALGLDSWLVMRHGGDRSLSSSSSSGSETCRLGCYFCNDVVAPENSTNNRTLDQQCTITRPGLSNIAASMAVELMVSLIHHPLGHAAPAPRSTKSGAGSSEYKPSIAEDNVDDEESMSSPLGLMPHQIRGSIVSYTMMTPTVPAFTHCSGCSDAIIECYRSKGFDFVKEVCNSVDGTYLDEVSGLTEFRSKAEKMMEAAMEDWDDDSDVEEDGDDF